MKFLLPFLFLLSNLIHAQTLSGDTRSACETLLCLTSNVRPPECKQSIARYYSIRGVSVGDTSVARQSYLSLCPVVGQPGASTLNSALTAIDRFASQCSPLQLNTNTFDAQVYACKDKDGHPSGYVLSKTDECNDQAVIKVVDDRLPAQCIGDVWTSGIRPRYVGNIIAGGHWE